ncbi:hypothetical protein [Vibrio campbellii]|uniref:H-NS family histone-like protein n=1 Tax=Vibrio campbellii TaxID=680 RepID=UPI000CD33C3C|nr:hypothetical protein [Vibrio campbellii]AUW07381.1 hypothetical protein C1N51_27345 [Vibrio campbellii]
MTESIEKTHLDSRVIIDKMLKNPYLMKELLKDTPLQDLISLQEKLTILKKEKVEENDKKEKAQAVINDKVKQCNVLLEELGISRLFKIVPIKDVTITDNPAHVCMAYMYKGEVLVTRRTTRGLLPKEIRSFTEEHGITYKDIIVNESEVKQIIETQTLPEQILSKLKK